jgi:hypothetical protein
MRRMTSRRGGSDERRHTGGSDTRIIMDQDDKVLIGSGRENAARSRPRSYRPTSSPSSQCRVKDPVIQWRDAVGTLLSWLLVDPFPVPDAGAASVLVDELNAGGFERMANRKIVSGGQ